MTRILDVCCGSRMFHFDKYNREVLYMDIRKEFEVLPTGHVIDVNPDVGNDFRDMPFASESFYLVIFDPPHLIKAGETSWLAKKYGKLDKRTWGEDIKQGFNECMRVLKVNGTLIFKWNEEQVKLTEILKVLDHQPIIGNKRAKTHWLVFFKTEGE